MNDGRVAREVLNRNRVIPKQRNAKKNRENPTSGNFDALNGRLKVSLIQGELNSGSHFRVTTRQLRPRSLYSWHRMESPQQPCSETSIQIQQLGSRLQCTKSTSWFPFTANTLMYGLTPHNTACTICTNSA
jgi:hypothetical protein